MSRTTAIVLGFVLIAVCVIAAISALGSNANSTFSKIGFAVGDAPAAKGAAGKQAEGAAAVNKPLPVPAERKIIYTGTLDVVVTNMDEVLPQVEKLVVAQKGFVARSEVKEDSGKRRTATFTLRIPVDGFQNARDGLVSLGTPERNAIDSEDVTDEYADVQGWIKNYKEEEDKLNVLLKERRKDEKLDDILKFSKRIEEVRREIDHMQGRLNRLENRTSLATINLTLREVKDYKPPTAPTFGNRINSTFDNSWDGLVKFGENVVLFFVAFTPWLVVIVPIGIVCLVIARISRKSRPPASPTAPST